MTAAHLCRFRPPPSGSLLIWEITNYCNLRCVHCCTESGPTAPNRRVPLARLQSVARELAPAGVRAVYFSGGEPFAEEGFLDLLSAVDTKRCETHVASNGYFLDKSTVERLRTLRLARVTISLDGHDAATHSKLRISPSSFERALRAISLCVESCVPVRVSGVVTQQNKDHVESYIRLLIERGVTAIVLNLVLPVGRARFHSEILLDENATRQAKAILGRMKKKYEDKATIDFSFNGSAVKVPTLCPAVTGVLHIASNGDVSPCSWLYKINPAKFRLGNIAVDGLASCIERRGKQLLRSAIFSGKGCPIPRALDEAKQSGTRLAIST